MTDNRIKGEIIKVDMHGRIVIPKNIRRDLKWQKGDVLKFFYGDDSIKLKNIKSE